MTSKQWFPKKHQVLVSLLKNMPKIVEIRFLANWVVINRFESFDLRFSFARQFLVIFATMVLFNIKTKVPLLNLKPPFMCIVSPIDGCDNLQAELLKRAKLTFPPFLSKVFNNVICLGFPSSWTSNIIYPIFKFGDPNELSNHRTIMIGHTMANLYTTIIK